MFLSAAYFQTSAFVFHKYLIEGVPGYTFSWKYNPFANWPLLYRCDASSEHATSFYKSFIESSLTTYRMKTIPLS